MVDDDDTRCEGVVVVASAAMRLGVLITMCRRREE